ncbi:hypothetical protein ACDP95_02145 [Weissella confusa]
MFKRKKRGFWDTREERHQEFYNDIFTKDPQPGDEMNEFELWLRRRRGEDVSIYKIAEPRRSGWLERLFFGGI